jgi:TPR repeat protein
MNRLLILPVLLLTLLVGTPAFSADYQKGETAYDSGDYATALRPLAEQGDVYSQWYLGWAYSRRRGVPQDYKTAMKWYRLAAEQGYPDAQHDLGSMYGNGQGVPQDYIRAHMWWNIVASSGNKEAVENRDKVSKRITPADISA